MEYLLGFSQTKWVIYRHYIKLWEVVFFTLNLYIQLDCNAWNFAVKAKYVYAFQSPDSQSHPKAESHMRGFLVCIA